MLAPEQLALLLLHLQHQQQVTLPNITLEIDNNQSLKFNK